MSNTLHHIVLHVNIRFFLFTSIIQHDITVDADFIILRCLTLEKYAYHDSGNCSDSRALILDKLSNRLGDFFVCD